MKRLFLFAAALLIASPAIAADVTYKVTPRVQATAAHNWTGFYLGANLGYGWGDTDNAFVNPKPDGFTAGIEARALKQYGNFVIGLGLDENYADFKDNLGLGGGINVEARVRSYGTGRLILGITPGNNWLFYGTGGVTWANTKATVSNGGQSISGSDTSVGWTLGAGIEYAFADSWSVKGEYRYLDFGTAHVGANIVPGVAISTDAKTTENVVLIGIQKRW